VVDVSVSGRSAAFAGSSAGSERFGSRRDACRDLDRQVARISTDYHVAGPIVVCCECRSRTCNKQLELTLAQWEAVQSRPDCSVLEPGHDNPRVERIVETHPNCLIVEPVGRSACEFIEVVVTESSEWRHLASLAERYGLHIYDEPTGSAPAEEPTWASVGVPRAQTRDEAEQVVAGLLEVVLHERRPAGGSWPTTR
jgi:hypothetical protein